MKIVVARTAGFCMGVKRAVEMVLDAPSEQEPPIQTYGPLIHNPQVLELLEEKGIRVLDSVPDAGSGTVIIRAHGVPPEEKTALVQAGFRVIDATCPRVIKVQQIIRKHARQGFSIVILGDADHPEVKGLKGFSEGKGFVVADLDELSRLPVFERAIVVAQTTYNSNLFLEVKQWLLQHRPDYTVFDTICDSTSTRQAEVRELARVCDLLIVVGGKTSGNTRRLAEVAEQNGVRTLAVESDMDIDPAALEGVNVVGITAGASTPNWVINRVVRRVEGLSLKRSLGVKRTWFVLQQALLLTNVYVALGAGALCVACSKLLSIPGSKGHAVIAMLYVLSMHMLNNLTGSHADRYNDPDREKFYRRHRRPLGIMAVVSGAAGIWYAFGLGWVPFLVLLFMSVTGLSYNVPVIPHRPKVRIRRLRDIPGSKTVLIAVAWGVVTALLPALSHFRMLPIEALPVFLWGSGLVFVRTAFFDILDMQGDRIVGRETIPLVLGEEKTFRMLYVFLYALGLLPILGVLLGWFPHWAVFLAICPALMGWIIGWHRRGHMMPGIRLEFRMETALLLSGAVAGAAALLGLP
uniref:4-hydroxy-3-methylbut-2-enyl diphosphate reductase n=1 Tax=Desulfatirhabdium butyrativorans TaxID=340467 RepID=A0A7C4MM81_9BACT